jgi:hypothetical protein
MKRRKSSKSNSPTVFDPVAASVPATVPAVVAERDDSPFLLLPSSSSMWSGYEAANASPARGYLWYPTTDPRRELSSLSEAEIRRRIKWLWNNFPFTRRLCKGPAKLLGIQTPQPVTSDDAWNELVFEDFSANAGNPLYFDRRGRFDFFTSQPVRNTLRFRDGRVLGVFTETVTGGAQMAFYEADQNVNPPDGHLRGWEQGQKTDEADRPLAYSLRDGKDPNRFYEIDARNAIYYGNFEGFGSLIGESILIPMVCDMMDVVELRGLRKHGAKNAADLGVVIERDRAVRVSSSGMPGLAGPVYETEVGTGDGAKKQRIKWEIVTAQGVVPRLQDGEKLRIVTDDRPTPNNQAFENALLETIIMGADLPAAALYFAVGRSLPGPAIRFTMEEIERWITIRHRQSAQENRRYYSVYVAKRITQFRESRGKFGIPPHPKGEKWWNKVDMIGQPSMTIDRDRNASATVVRLESGLTTWTNEYAKDGLHGRRELREKIFETGWVKAQVREAAEHFEVDLTLGECFPRLAGAGAKDDPVVNDAFRRASEKDGAPPESDP